MRKLLQLLFILSFCVTMINCNNSKQNGSDTNVSFTSFWVSFIKAFNDKKAPEINKYINSKYGFFVIDNPGAYSIVQHFNSFDEIMKMEGEHDIAHLKVMKVENDLKDGKKPFYDCEKESWDKQGCFLEVAPESKITYYYETMIEYELADPSIVKDEMVLSKKSDSMITHLVYNTEATVGFYFGKIDDRWYLLCIDKVTSCSA
ncbi:MAG: hypothetical protein ISS16_11155 [Ignavibacteria bacterium]|nr:hypothetical protein [Ignavibacteria bacterium]